MDHKLLEEVFYAFPTSCFLSPHLLTPQDFVVLLMSAQTCPVWVNLFIYVLYGQLQAVVSLLMDVSAGIQACAFHNAWALSPTWGSPILSEDQFLVTGLLLSSHKDSLRVEGCAIHVKLFRQGERIKNLKSLCLYDTESQKTPPANPKKHPKQPTNQNKTKILSNETSKATLYQTLYITYIYILEPFWHCKDIEKTFPTDWWLLLLCRQEWSNRLFQVATVTGKAFLQNLGYFFKLLCQVFSTAKYRACIQSSRRAPQNWAGLASSAPGVNRIRRQPTASEPWLQSSQQCPSWAKLCGETQLSPDMSWYCSNTREDILKICYKY